MLFFFFPFNIVTQLNLLSSAHLPDTPACGGGCLGWAAQGVWEGGVLPREEASHKESA